MLKILQTLFFLNLILTAQLFTDETTPLPEKKSSLHIELEVNALPFVGVQTPKRKASFQEKEITPDIENGYGYNIYLGLDILEYFDSDNFFLGVGFLYQQSKHDSSLKLYTATISTYQAEVNVRNFLLNSPTISVFQRYGISVGMSDFEYNKNREDFESGVIGFRYVLGVEIKKHFFADMGGGMFLWGEPGKTLAYGGYLSLGFGFKF